MKKKIFALSMAALLLAMVAVGGTIAYFTAEDSAVNTMTLGSVSIEQLEYERVVEDGAWVAGDNGDDLLQEFTQDKPLYPVYYADGVIKYDDRTQGHTQSFEQVGAEGSVYLFDDSVKGAVDKMVLVENTGKSDAYVRTLVAFEYGSFDQTKTFLGINFGSTDWEVGADVFAEIDGNTYEVVEFIYKADGGILASGEVTNTPSLLQLYMRPDATNETVEAIDGNDNGLYDVLVLSQACQVAGFEGAGADTALDTAFGDVTAANAKTWFEAILPQD